MFGNCNHCCFCCGHPCTMLGVSLFISCKNKIQCVCVEKKKKYMTDPEPKPASRDFPGGPVVKNPPSNAGDTGLIPGPGTKIPHVVGQLSPRTATTESACCNYKAHTLWSLGATTREKPVHHNEEPTCRNDDPVCRNDDPVCCN